MLALTSRIDERITIIVPPSTTPTTITLMQLDIRGDKSRLGFEAPKEVLIHRDEAKEKTLAKHVEEEIDI